MIAVHRLVLLLLFVVWTEPSRSYTTDGSGGTGNVRQAVPPPPYLPSIARSPSMILVCALCFVLCSGSSGRWISILIIITVCLQCSSVPVVYSMYGITNASSSLLCCTGTVHTSYTVRPVLVYLLLCMTLHSVLSIYLPPGGGGIFSPLSSTALSVTRARERDRRDTAACPRLFRHRIEKGTKAACYHGIV